MLICKRETLRAKKFEAREWAKPGCYVLMGEYSPPFWKPRSGVILRARPGMSKGDIVNRLDQHIAGESDWFDKAILIRDISEMSSTTAGYIEGLLHDWCRGAAFVAHLDRRDSDDSGHPADKAMLDASVIPLIRCGVELAGVPLDTRDDINQLRKLRPRARDDAQRPLDEG